MASNSINSVKYNVYSVKKDRFTVWALKSWIKTTTDQMKSNQTIL